MVDDTSDPGYNESMPVTTSAANGTPQERTTTEDRDVEAAWAFADVLRRRWKLLVGILTALGVTGGGVSAVGWSQDFAVQIGRAQVDGALGDPTVRPGAPGGPADDGNVARWYGWIMGIDAKASAAVAAAKENRKVIGTVQASVQSVIEGQGFEVCVSIGGIPGVRPHPSPPDDEPGATQRICTPLDKDWLPLPAIPLANVDELRTHQAAQIQARTAKARKKAAR